MSNLLQTIHQMMEKHHADQIQTLDFREISSDYDYFVIGSVSNVRISWALVGYLEDELSKLGYDIRKIEGHKESRWILIDCYEVVVHLFVAEERDLYQLEKLWSDVPRLKDKL